MTGVIKTCFEANLDDRNFLLDEKLFSPFHLKSVNKMIGCLSGRPLKHPNEVVQTQTTNLSDITSSDFPIYISGNELMNLVDLERS